MKELRGVGASTGIVVGPAKICQYAELEVAEAKDELPFKDKLETLRDALEKTTNDIRQSYARVEATNPKGAKIFEAHVLFLQDPTLLERIESMLREGYGVAYSVKRSFEESARQLEQLEDGYLRERAGDLRDVSERVLGTILHRSKTGAVLLLEPSIIVASDLTPSDTARLDRSSVLGFVTEKGGATSHTAILAEALGIPAVVGVKNALREIRDEDELIIDGRQGLVIVGPEEETIRAYARRREELERESATLRENATLTRPRRSSKKVEVTANIGSPRDVEKALQVGADGVGLYRTEFLFLDRDCPPSEEEQFEAYRIVLEQFSGKPVTIRTLDIGGDKEIRYLNLDKELNPSLGVRGIRLCLEHRDLFKTQLRAVLRASTYGRARIMYPMVAVREEIVEARAVLEEVKKELTENGTTFDKGIEVGIMVEVPSAALNAEELADHVDFFSIGTNDLVQYTFAADRTNENLSYLYQPQNSAVLGLVKMTVDASHRRGKWTGVCGELAGDAEAIPTLVGLGVDELSMSSQKIPFAQKILFEL
ncbi:phosphoenolpyruvate--protein phosphotransferase [Candidatus Cryosericum terrychapinii]|uniref:Phosphoenolpyruvate-protein phosphotransferase n=1 Tax=Candidatus Cryosericum terrychapinii TaxID=2290919 RepID=A0A398D6R1_9BACT|nr:phosphoenolpyruvate--protein phosphotransferase [Candidatus Cryosericum terrychapinii]RIE06784.1 phosphoenolpyruvate--protein phosphotransferase [Candidatus Cryosericum terrychapinii]